MIEDETTFRKDITIGRFRIDSLARHVNANEVQRSRQSTSAFAYVFGAVIVAIVGMLAWSWVDAGVDTGVRATGQVTRCPMWLRRQRACTVELEGGKMVSVFMPKHQAGDKVSLMLMRRPLSSGEYYSPAY